MEVDSVQGYRAAVQQIIVDELGDRLVGCYAYGSVLSQEFVPGRSDLDLLTLTRDWLPQSIEQTVIERLRTLSRPAAIKGLDIWFLPLASSLRPGETPRYQVRMLTTLDFVYRDLQSPYRDPRLPMLLAICRNHSVAVVGPPPIQVFGRVPLAGIIGGMLADLGSQAPAHYRVLNACRDLHFLLEGRMCSKFQGVAWARGRLGPPELLDAAAQWQRQGSGPVLDPAAVDALVAVVAERLRDAIQYGTLPPACRRWRSVDPLHQVGLQRGGPRVSCVMPTYNRRDFVERSIRLFLAQDYPNRELLIVDDGEDEIADLVPPGGSVRQLRLPRRTTIGEKRNLAAEAADGEVLVQWDDDDWYGPTRLSRQLGPLVAGHADLTAIQKSWLVDLDTGRFFRRQVLPRRLTDALALGTLALTTDLWRRSRRYPAASRLEDFTMFLRATDLGARVESIPNDGIYVYVRHGANSWRFDRAPRDHTWWTESPPPEFLSRRELADHFPLPLPHSH